MKWNTQVVVVVLLGSVVGGVMPRVWRPHNALSPGDSVVVSVQPKPETAEPAASEEREAPPVVLPRPPEPPAAPTKPAPPPRSSADVDPDVLAAKAIVERNAHWLFTRDREGNFVRDERGQRVLTEVGKRYAAHVVAADEAGVKGAENQHAWAVRKLAAEMAEAEAARPRPGGALVLAGAARKVPDLRGRKTTVVAESRECARTAWFVMQQNRVPWETPPEDADVVLVVVPSARAL